MTKRLFTNNASTTLSTAALITDQTLAVTDGSTFTTPSAGDWQDVTVTDGVNVEIVKMTGRAGNVLTVERGQQGTVARAWVSGTTVEARLTAGAVADLVDRVVALETAPAEAPPLAVSAKTADYVLAAGDANGYVRVNAAAPVTITVPQDTSQAFAVGAAVRLRQVGAGQVAVQGEAQVSEPTVWTARAPGLGTQTPDVLAHLNGLFVAGGTSGGLSTSPDGVGWTARTSNLGANQVLALFHAAALYVACAMNGKLATSPDAVTWTARTSGFGTDSVSAIAYGAGLFVIAGGAGKLATSPDGVTWTLRTSGFGTSAITSVVFNGSVFVAVGGDGKVATSPDGVTWTLQTGAVGTSYTRGVLWTGVAFVCWTVGGKIATSPDGVTWTLQTSPFTASDTVYGVAYGAGTLVAVAGAAGLLATSSDGGVTWVSRTSSFGGTYIDGVAFGGGVFVAYGTGGKLATSLDGAIWTQQAPGFGTQSVASAAYGAGVFVAGAASGLLASAPGGTVGTTINTPETLKLKKQHATALLVKVGPNEWDLSGELEAAV